MQIFGNVRKPFYSYIIYSTNICGDGGRKMAQFGFIGMGNMGYAMLNGVLGEFAPGQIIFTTPHKEKCEKISAQTGVKYAMFFKTASYICGLTAKIIYFALFAHSALLSAYFTPVCALIFSHFSLCGVVKTVLPVLR